MQRDSQHIILASMTLTATTDSGAFTPGVAVEIITWGFIITTALSGTVMIVTADKRITAGSDTGRITGTVSAGFGIMSPTSAQVLLATAGKVLQCSPSPVATGEQKLVLYPGQQMLLKPGTAMGSAGAALPFIEYKVADEKEQFSTASALSVLGLSAAVGLGNVIEIDA